MYKYTETRSLHIYRSAVFVLGPPGGPHRVAYVAYRAGPDAPFQPVLAAQVCFLPCREHRFHAVLDFINGAALSPTDEESEAFFDFLAIEYVELSLPVEEEEAAWPEGHALALAAAAGNEEAQEKLGDMALAAGFSLVEIAAVPTWKAVADMITKSTKIAPFSAN
jgi:hypothetical protein